MKRLLILPAIVIFLLLILPMPALANAPPPPPELIDILVDGYSDIKTVYIYGYDQNNEYKYAGRGTSSRETKLQNERIISFYNKDAQLKSFQLVVKLKSGEDLQSNFVDFSERGSYVYSIKDNVLKQGAILSRKPNGTIVFFGGIILVFPLLFTLVVEWIISLFFKLKPGKYVVYINIITNLAMNVLILIMYSTLVIDYLKIIICLEAAVMAVEYLYYSKKYKNISKKRLVAFVITANLASWLLYWLFGGMFRY